MICIPTDQLRCSSTPSYPRKPPALVVFLVGDASVLVWRARGQARLVCSRKTLRFQPQTHLYFKPGYRNEDSVLGLAEPLALPKTPRASAAPAQGGISPLVAPEPLCLRWLCRRPLTRAANELCHSPGDSLWPAAGCGA